MAALLGFVKGFIALFFVLNVLVNMVPKENFQKYIRFFAEMVLSLGLISPVLSYVGDSDAFLQMIEYETFLEELEEASVDAGKITYMQNDYYVAEYEKALELDLSALVEEEGFVVRAVEVQLSDEYEIEKIQLEITVKGNENIVIGKIVVESDTEEQEHENEDAAYRRLKEKLISYYQLSENQLTILYD